MERTGRPSRVTAEAEPALTITPSRSRLYPAGSPVTVMPLPGSPTNTLTNVLPGVNTDWLSEVLRPAPISNWITLLTTRGCRMV